jgi:hypothetical protein
MFRIPVNFGSVIEARVKAVAAPQLGAARSKIEAAMMKGAGKFANRMAGSMPPASGPRSEKNMLRAIEIDLDHLYWTPSNLMNALVNKVPDNIRSAIGRAMDQQDWPRMRRLLRRAGGKFSGIILGQALDVRYHDTAIRDQHYRVRVVQRKQLVTQHELYSYAHYLSWRVGRAASGWGTCAVKLGVGEFLGGEKNGQLHPGLGSVHIERGIGFKITLTNYIPYAQRLVEVSVRDRYLAEARETIMQELGA